MAAKPLMGAEGWKPHELTDEQLGRVAYDAYGRGLGLLAWEALPMGMRDMWVRAALAVARVVEEGD